jgi:Mrp family chromosome partitioning ATPase
VNASRPAHPGDDPDTGQYTMEILHILWRHRLLIAAVTIVTAAAAFGLSHLQAKQYEATAQMILADPGSSSIFDSSGLVVDPTRHVRTQAEVATSGPVLTRASRMLDGRLGTDELDDAVSVRASRDLDLVTIHALDATPDGAAEIADAVGLSYQQLVSDDVQAKASAAIAELDAARTEIQARIDDLEQAIAADPDNAALRAERDAAVAEAVSLEGRARQVAVDAALYGSGVLLFEPASPPEGPARPQPLRTAVLAGFVGLVGAAGFAWWRSQRSLTAEHRHEPASILRAPLLGVVPDLGAMMVTSHAPALTDPESAAAEAYNFVAASLMHAVGNRPAVVLVTSPGQGDGKTVTALNTAVAVARGGSDVVLVDGDERVRGLTRWFGIPHSAGLTDLGNGRTYEECSSLLVGWEGAAFSVVPAGSRAGNSAGFFRSSGFARALTALRAREALVVVDSPPTLVVADALAIAPHADGVVLVIRQGTQLAAIQDVRDRIVTAGTPILGYVFNRTRQRSSGGYGHGYDYAGYRLSPRPEPNGHSRRAVRAARR